MDEYKKKLKIEVKNLKECQQKEGVSSCFKCDKMFKCELRLTYVRSVYESMSKGKVGGFEF